jgi:MATE family multidrug resistance protein
MTEIKTIAKHASSVLVGQLAVMAYGVADTVIAGRYSDAALASLSVGSAIYISVYVGLLGIVMALLPIWAEMRGASRFEEMGKSLRQSLYLSFLIVLLGMTALLFPGPLLRWAQVPDLMQGEVVRYLRVLAFAFAPALLFRVYSSFNQALGKPLLVTWLQVGALGLKIPLSIWLVGGGAGIEPMGAVGCAWATLIVSYALMALGLVMLRTQRLYRPFGIWRPMEKPDWRQIGEFARLGIPGGLAYMVEITSFTLMALFIARLGTTASASHQIAASLGAILYMVPLSMAIACSARVSYWLGAGHPDKAKRIVITSLQATMLIALLLGTTLFISRHVLASLYSTSPDIVRMGATLLAWVALFHLADATQALCSFLLRCYRITLKPLALYGILLWGMGLYGGYLMAYEGLFGQPATQKAVSFWVTSTAALALVAVCFLLLLWRAVAGSMNSHRSTIAAHAVV